MKRLFWITLLSAFAFSAAAAAEPVVIEVEAPLYRVVQFAKVRQSHGKWGSVEIKRIQKEINKDGVVDDAERKLVEAALAGDKIELHSMRNGAPVSLTVTPKLSDESKAQLAAALGDEDGFFGKPVEGHTSLQVQILGETTSYPHYNDVNLFDKKDMPFLTVLSGVFGIVVFESEANFAPVFNGSAPVTEGDFITLLKGMADNNDEDWQPDCEFEGGPLDPTSNRQMTVAGMNACLTNIFSNDGYNSGPLDRSRLIKQTVTAYSHASDEGWLKP